MLRIRFILIWIRIPGSGSYSESFLKSRKYQLFFLSKIYFSKKWSILLFMGKYLTLLFLNKMYDIYSYDFCGNFRDFSWFFATWIRIWIRFMEADPDPKWNGSKRIRIRNTWIFNHFKSLARSFLKTFQLNTIEFKRSCIIF